MNKKICALIAVTAFSCGCETAFVQQPRPHSRILLAIRTRAFTAPRTTSLTSIRSLLISQRLMRLPSFSALAYSLAPCPGPPPHSALTLDAYQAQDSFIAIGEREAHVIGVIVSFRYGNDFNEEAVRRIAETARPKFEGMPGLRSKAFTFDAAKHEATNFYVWDSEDAARSFFTEQTIERISGVYGVRPTVQYVQIASLVQNTKTS